MTEREALLHVVRGAVAALERSRDRIDDLNVYPVPDGDTGTNLALTARAVLEALEDSAAEDRPTIARETTRAALMGARGNSGVILSQIVRGIAESLEAEGPLDGGVVARALRGGSDAAYRAVRNPVEGTMLTAIRALAEAAEAEQSRPVAELLELLVTRGEVAVARTQEQLDVLREAGVVDAGAAGLVELLRGIASVVAGQPLPEEPPVERASVEAAHQELSRFRYCTTFVIEGDLDPDALEAEYERLGDSLLVVGDEHALKVHVHTDDPGAALAIGTRVGAIENVEIADMHRQTQARERRLLAAVPDPPPAATGVVAVVAGPGNRLLFESLGATRIVEGGQTMNPSAAELLAAVEATNAPEAILLPNNPNIVLVSEQAVSLAAKPARVVPTTSMQAGLAALVAFNPELSAEENESAMVEAAARVATGAVTTASRNVSLNGRAVEVGQYVGLLDDEPVTGGAEFEPVARAILEGLLAEPREVVTLLTGEEEPDLSRLLAELEQSNPELEIEVHEGGQPHYPLLVSAE
ncbi:MAG: DAK2 domain-containing protein [Actinobacteria bacterium]|nr:MAG: DAK2 domain-containing protein [Actinomycetota bacterium]